MKKTLEVLNKLVAERVIRDYAIGGAMGALWYMEAITTMDLDIFVLFIDETLLDPISPIYKRLKELGYEPDPNQSECVNIEGVPVQFLPVYNVLLNDAMRNARSFDYEDVPTKVLSAEHLAAICVQTGRIKDKIRVEMFLRSRQFDKEMFLSILDKYQLRERFSAWNLM